MKRITALHYLPLPILLLIFLVTAGGCSTHPTLPDSSEGPAMAFGNRISIELEVGGIQSQTVDMSILYHGNTQDTYSDTTYNSGASPHTFKDSWQSREWTVTRSGDTVTYTHRQTLSAYETSTVRVVFDTVHHIIVSAGHYEAGQTSYGSLVSEHANNYDQLSSRIVITNVPYTIRANGSVEALLTGNQAAEHITENSYSYRFTTKRYNAVAESGSSRDVRTTVLGISPEQASISLVMQ